MEERKITKEEFDDAVKKVVEDMLEDEKFEGLSKLMVPMIGTMFASRMRSALFDNNQEEEIKND